MNKITFSLLMFGLSALSLSANPATSLRNARRSQVALSPQQVSHTKAVTDEDLYKVTMVISENFDKFTAGTATEPDTKKVENPITETIDPAFTQTPGWFGFEVYQAAGAAYLGYNEEKKATGTFTTPDLDLSGKDLPLVVTLRARRNALPDGNKDWVCVDVIRTSDNRPFTNEYAYVTEEWQEFRFEFPKRREVGEKYYIQFYGYGHPVFIDDIEVKFCEPYLDTPVATEFTNFTATGFTANWEQTPGATKYLLSVYTLGANKEKVWVQQDIETQDLSYSFTNLNTIDNIYYYVVRASDGTHVSPESKAVKVESLLTPQLKPEVALSKNEFQIAWEAIPNAQYYNLNAFINHTAKAAETYLFAEEDFAKVAPGEQYTIETPFMDLPREVELDEYLDQPGWISSGAVLVNGMLGLDGRGYDYYGIPIYVQSTELDLSNGGGTVKVSADLLGIGGTRAIVRLLHLDPEQNKLVVDDKIKVEDLTTEWKKYNFELKGGQKKSYVEICCYGPTYMYIDNLTIAQDLNANEHVSVPFINTKVKEGVSANITIPARAANDEIAYNVTAVKEVWDEYGFSCDYIVYSQTASGTYSASGNSIDGTAADASGVKAVLSQGVLTVMNPAQAPVSVYTTSGVLVYSSKGQSQVSVQLPKRGIYVVKVGHQTLKVM